MLQDLDRAECLGLLAEGRRGRLVVAAPDSGPIIRPVSCVYDPVTRTVVFRTVGAAGLRALLNQRAALEVDGLENGSSPWSVIVQGLVEEVDRSLRISTAVVRGRGVRGRLATFSRLRADDD
jgi:nitroimidazol reductase NimA-like FMN-containing flavoprotein (pyridoxamine 5'-phosphate oxidase superfamily)